MSRAKDDLLITLAGLEDAAKRLVAPGLGQGSQRSPDYLLLNGLHVMAFAALEHFLRQRTLEVLSALTIKPVTFPDLPASLQKQILQEWIRGMGAFLVRNNDQAKAQTLLLEAEIIGTSASKTQFTLSDYSFGRSQSNISYSQIKDLIDALNISGSVNCLFDLLSGAGLSPLEGPDQVFKRLSSNRHTAAHGFGLDFKLAEFIEDMKLGAKTLSFSFDSCISHAAHIIRNEIASHQIFSTINISSVKLRSIRFDSIQKNWNVFLGSTPMPSFSQGQYQKKMEAFRKRSATPGEIIFVVDGSGHLIDWVQPI